MSDLINHGACGKSWSGLSRGHCSGCCQTFSAGAFDAHQRIKDGIVTCSTEKLVPSEEPWGTLWRLPAAEGGSYWDRRREAEEDAA